MPTYSDISETTPNQSRKIFSLNGNAAVELMTCYDGKKFSLHLKDHQLFLVMQGSLNILYGGMDVVVEKGQMVFLRKGILMECSAEIGFGLEKTEYMVFSFDYEVLKEFSKLTELTPVAGGERPPILSSEMDIRMLKYIESLACYFDNSEKLMGNFLKIKLFELLFSLSGDQEGILVQLLDLKSDYRCDITKTVEENLMNGLSVNEIARLSGRSLSSFRRDFLAVYNRTPSEWIREKRMEKAQELLLATSMSITNICYTVGLESIAHFSRVFKSHFGYAPSKLRSNVLVA